MGLLSSNPGTWLPIDSSGGRTTIDYAHHEIHAGNHYAFTHSVSVGTGTAASVVLTTPASGDVHLTFGVTTSNTATWIFDEGPNTTGGTTIVAYNNDRGSTTTSGCVLVHTPTYGTSGTVLLNGLNGSGGNPASSSGGEGETRNEYILAASTKYGIKVTALNAGTTVIINGAFYVES